MSKGIKQDHLGREYKSMGELAKAYGLTTTLVGNRLRIGWSLERALLTPKGVKLYQDHLGDIYQNKLELAQAYGVTVEDIDNRIGKQTIPEYISNTYIGQNGVEIDGNSYRNLRDVALSTGQYLSLVYYHYKKKTKESSLIGRRF